MAVPARRLITPARAFWSASWTADPSSPSPDKNKKKGPAGHHRLAAVMDAVNDRKLPPELRGRGNAVRYHPPAPYPTSRAQ
jgi:DnaJ homolog subfamily C member 28